jgi:hypothetical protein
MALSPVRPTPPGNEAVIGPNGDRHSQAWTQYHQAVSDWIAAQGIGITDGSEAGAGQIGEFMTASAAGAGLSTGSVADICNVTLQPGDWDVTGLASFNAGAGTHTSFGMGIGTVNVFNGSTFPSSAFTHGITTAPQRYNLTTATTVWLVAEAVFTGTMTVDATITARRMR